MSEFLIEPRPLSEAEQLAALEFGRAELNALFKVTDDFVRERTGLETYERAQARLELINDPPATDLPADLRLKSEQQLNARAETVARDLFMRDHADETNASQLRMARSMLQHRFPELTPLGVLNEPDVLIEIGRDIINITDTDRALEHEDIQRLYAMESLADDILGSYYAGAIGLPRGQIEVTIAEQHLDFFWLTRESMEDTSSPVVEHHQRASIYVKDGRLWLNDRPVTTTGQLAEIQAVFRPMEEVIRRFEAGEDIEQHY